jgi:peroxidase
VGLQQEVLNLIEDIRAKVHAQCGATVSCADITVLATRDAVSLAGGPAFSVSLGRLDSLAPASDSDVFKLPPPTATVDELLSAFSAAGLADPADLVSLSGAHTVGKARCSAFGAATAPGADGDVTRCVTEACSAAGSGDRLRDLDFLTPTAFDNLYFVELALRKSNGVMLPSDQALVTDPRTSWLVQGFADNHWWFFDQFKTSMIKMSNLRGPQGNVGEVRRSCFRRNSNANSNAAADAAAAGEEEGVVAAA